MLFPSLPSGTSVVLDWLDLKIQAVSCQRQLDFPARLSTMAWPIQLPSVVVKMGYWGGRRSSSPRKILPHSTFGQHLVYTCCCSTMVRSSACIFSSFARGLVGWDYGSRKIWSPLGIRFSNVPQSHRSNLYRRVHALVPECRALAAILHSAYTLTLLSGQTILTLHFFGGLQYRADSRPDPCSRDFVEEAQEPGEGARGTLSRKFEEEEGTTSNSSPLINYKTVDDGDDIQIAWLGLRVDGVALHNHLSGLSQPWDLQL